MTQPDLIGVLNFGESKSLTTPNGRVVLVTTDLDGVGYRVEVGALLRRGTLVENRYVDYPCGRTQLQQSLSGIWRTNNKPTEDAGQ